jgi:hypothetical protein
MALPPLHQIVDAANSAADKLTPDYFLQFGTANAMVRGFAGAYLLARAVQMASCAFAPGFYERHLPWIQRAVEIGLPASVIVGSYLFPDAGDALKGVIQAHPVYSAGMASAWAGGALAVERDRRFRVQCEQDEERTSELTDRLANAWASH